MRGHSSLGESQRGDVLRSPVETRWKQGARRLRSGAAQWRRSAVTRLRGLPSDDQGSISVASVFALLMLAILLGLVMNSTRQADQKVRLQNAADAATYSGGIAVTRGMNTLAFTNHLLADVFALTAYMREARDGNAARLTPEILDNWERIGPFLATSEWPPFADLGQAIQEKVPLERELITTFGEWVAESSRQMLPVLEGILAEELIPQFQRTVVAVTPLQSQLAADETARRHGASWPRPVELRAVMWRTLGEEVGGDSEANWRSIPAVDPVFDTVPSLPQYQQNARTQRRDLARRYLADWNNETLAFFDRGGKMSQFANLWRIFTCGQLRRLLEVEYPDRNLPMQIRFANEPPATPNEYVERDFMFVGVVYRPKMADFVPRVFRNPSVADTQAYAQLALFVPQRRIIWAQQQSGGTPSTSIGGVPGNVITISPPSPPPSGAPPTSTWVVAWEGGGRHPTRWNLVTQNWHVQLVPATTDNIPLILSTPPTMNGVTATVPDYQSLIAEDLPWLSQH